VDPQELPRAMGLARIEAIASHIPDAVLDNAALAALYPDWPPEKILDKTGIAERRIAAAGETSADLAEAAARKLFAAGVDPASIDYLLFCTQTPDYVLPTTACVLQTRLGLRTSIGALDFNLGCSGFVYGLSLAKGLIETGQARRVLLLTADTYSKLIHPMDRSVRTLFGDGAAATLVSACDAVAPQIGPFVFGTDGEGAQNLIVPSGGYRIPRSPETAVEQTDASGNVRSADNLYMNGPAIMAFTLREVPAAIARLGEITGRSLNDYDVVAFHQANGFMLERLRAKLGIDPSRFALRLETCGNTVSSTIPIALEPLIGGSVRKHALLVGFGVGYSWAACEAVLPSQGDLQ
jgi:3-oxoacyl-[acyl-carrier-protein] synthase III